MLRTISMKLIIDQKTASLLTDLQNAFAFACNSIVPFVVEKRCWNRVALHNIVYSQLRKESLLGSQMVCNAIFAVSKAYKAQKLLGKIVKDEKIPEISFRKASIHFDKRTYTITPSGELSLYTLQGRVKVNFSMGEHQKQLFNLGLAKEAELVYRGGRWYFNLVIEIPDVPQIEEGIILGVDLGENNLATTSTGKIFGGKALCDQRDRFLALRRRLQSNGSQSAKQKLCKVSGRERRHVQHVNHEVSANIVAEAKRVGAKMIVLEDLTNIRKRIRAKKRGRTRLHRWAFSQLREFIAYKAEGVGIKVECVNPAYTSLCCSNCSQIGQRKRHKFTCFNCGLLTHADCNASRNLVRIVESIGTTRAEVNQPNVGILNAP